MLIARQMLLMRAHGKTQPLQPEFRELRAKEITLTPMGIPRVNVN